MLLLEDVVVVAAVSFSTPPVDPGGEDVVTGRREIHRFTRPTRPASRIDSPGIYRRKR